MDELWPQHTIHFKKCWFPLKENRSTSSFASLTYDSIWPMKYFFGTSIGLNIHISSFWNKKELKSIEFFRSESRPRFDQPVGFPYFGQKIASPSFCQRRKWYGLTLRATWIEKSGWDPSSLFIGKIWKPVDGANSHEMLSIPSYTTSFFCLTGSLCNPMNKHTEMPRNLSHIQENQRRKAWIVLYTNA